MNFRKLLFIQGKRNLVRVSSMVKLLCYIEENPRQKEKLCESTIRKNKFELLELEFPGSTEIQHKNTVVLANPRKRFQRIQRNNKSPK